MASSSTGNNKKMLSVHSAVRNQVHFEGETSEVEEAELGST